MRNGPEILLSISIAILLLSTVVSFMITPPDPDLPTDLEIQHVELNDGRSYTYTDVRRLRLKKIEDSLWVHITHYYKDELVAPEILVNVDHVLMMSLRTDKRK